MLGAVVEHPQYGRGQIVALYRNGTEWMVRFESGLRFRRPRREFVGQQEVTLAPAAPLPLPDVAPMPRSQFDARQLLEALRVGVAPAQHIEELTIGLQGGARQPRSRPESGASKWRSRSGRSGGLWFRQEPHR